MRRHHLRPRGAAADERPGPAYDRRLLRRLWRFVRPHWRVLVGSLALLPLAAALELAPPYLLKIAIDRAIVPGELRLLAPLAALLVGTLVAQNIANFGHTLLIQLCGQRAMHDLRIATHEHLLSLRVAFFDRSPVGRVMTRVTNDVESIAEAFASGLVAVIGDVLKLTGIVGVMLWLDARLALLAFSVLPLLLLLVLLFQRLLRAAHREIRARLARINATLQERITGMRIVQIFGRQRRVQRDFAAVNDAYRQAYHTAIRWDAALYAFVEMLGVLTVALLLWYGGGRVVLGAVTFGLLVAFIDYLQRFFQPIRDLSAKYAVMQQAMAASERVFALLDTDEPDCPPAPAGAEVPPASRPGAPAAVEYRGVRFGYSADAPLFDGLDLTVAPGETVAVVGATGAGKSSLVRLLTRLYELQEGAILLDGRDIRGLDRAELRSRVVVLSQEVFLFSGTVRDNIALGDPAISGEVVADAAARTGLARRLELDQPVGERGQMLSLGERQLVVFARALARDPQLLVLDEATASVDPESERLIQEGIAELMERRTALVIAHRLTTVERADRVVVLHRGRIVEQGTHAELLAAGGLYTHLYELQYVADTRRA